MKAASLCLLLGAAGLTLACVDTGQERVSVPLRLGGPLEPGPLETTQGFVVELEQADLAFGPLYLCAGVLAGDNCETARLEWLGSAVIDALSPDLGDAGSLVGVSGPVRSGMYDLGITSLLTLPQPLVLDAAASLDGNSVRLAGSASRELESVSFVLDLPIQQGDDAEIGVSVARLTSVPGLEHDVTGDEQDLTLRVDPRPWIRDIDFGAVIAAGLPDDGEPVRLAEDSQAARAVRAALLSGPRPSFEWSSASEALVSE